MPPCTQPYTCYVAMWYSPYDCPTTVTYGLSTPYSHHSLSYHSSVDHGWPTPSSHPHVFYGPCGYSTRVPYHVGPCRPLRPVTGLPGSDQRGVAQEKWSCGRPRPCLAYGLCFLVLPVVRSVRRPSSHDDVIRGSTWNHPDKAPFSYGRRHRHYDGRSISIVCHRKALF